MIRNVVFDVGNVLVNELGVKSQAHLDKQEQNDLQKIFFDDKPCNVEAARLLGMQAVVFTGINDVLAELPLSK